VQQEVLCNKEKWRKTMRINPNERQKASRIDTALIHLNQQGPSLIGSKEPCMLKWMANLCQDHCHQASKEKNICRYEK